MLSDEAKERRKAKARERYATDPKRREAAKQAALKSRRSESGKAYMRSYYKANKEKWDKINADPEFRERKNAARRERYATDPEFREKALYYSNNRNKRNKKDYILRTTFGIIIDDYERMLDEQDHKCYICRKPHEEKRRGRLVVDHCHESGFVRGLLCENCNYGLGHFKDDPKILFAAVRYIRKAQDRIMDSVVQSE